MTWQAKIKEIAWKLIVAVISWLSWPFLTRSFTPIAIEKLNDSIKDRVKKGGGKRTKNYIEIRDRHYDYIFIDAGKILPQRCYRRRFINTEDPSDVRDEILSQQRWNFTAQIGSIAALVLVAASTLTLTDNLPYINRPAVLLNFQMTGIFLMAATSFLFIRNLFRLDPDKFWGQTFVGLAGLCLVLGGIFFVVVSSVLVGGIFTSQTTEDGGGADPELSGNLAQAQSLLLQGANRSEAYVLLLPSDSDAPILYRLSSASIPFLDEHPLNISGQSEAADEGASLEVVVIEDGVVLGEDDLDAEVTEPFNGSVNETNTAPNAG